MNVKISQLEFRLSKRQTLSVADGAGVRIEAQAGTVWVTQDHDLRDVVLQPGQAVTLKGKGRAIVQAFEASRVRLSQPTAHVRPQGADWSARLAGLFRRVPSQAALA